MTVNLSTLDPNVYKQSLIDFLRTQTVFRDYPLEDSNINVLLDVLARNTYLNTFYKNQIFSESFLDSAQIRANIVSSAKDLNYIPGSRKSAMAVVDYTVNATGINALEMPKGTQFSGRSSLSSFTFTTDKAYIANAAGSTFSFSNIEIYEGAYLYVTYVVDSTTPQNFVITNEDVDISSIDVLVVNLDGTETPYTIANTTYGLRPDSQIFFIEGYSDNQYKIIFGSNIVGSQPVDGSTIIIAFRTAAGIDNANGISTFNIDQDIVTPVGGQAQNYTVVTVANSSGGAERETVESIRLLAPRSYSTNEVAVTSSDYNNLIRQEYQNIIEDVYAFGGETANPKQYGKVIIAVKIYGSDLTSQTMKNQIYGYISNKNVGPITPVIQDPDIYHLVINSNIIFNPTTTTKTINDIESMVNTTILNYANTTLGRFNTDFRYSHFTSLIDSTDTSITSNDTSVVLSKRILPLTNNSNQQFSINFSNQVNNNLVYPALSSSLFTWINSSNANTAINCYFSDDKAGNIHVYQLGVTNAPYEKNVGIIDYTSGLVNLNKILISDFNGDYLSINVVPSNKDILVNQIRMLTIDASDISVSGSSS